MTSDIHITQVVPGIYKIGPLETGMPSANTSPFLAWGNKRAAILEPGEEGQMPGLLEGIRKLEVKLDYIAYVFTTHIHLHHMQGVPELLKELPNAKFVVHPRAVPHVIEPTRLIESTIQAWGDKCYGPFKPVPKERVIGAEDGQVFDLGGKELEVVYTPGHAPHHICIFDRQTRALWVGDLTGSGAGGPGQERGRLEIQPPLYDPEKNVQSLRRVRALKPSVFLTFGKLENFNTERMLQWGEEDVLAVVRICREAMQQKANAAEIGQRVEKYYRSLGIEPGAETPLVGGVGQAPFGLLNYLKRQDPSLEMPTGVRARRADAP